MPKDNPDSVQLPLFDPITIKLTKGYETTVDPIDADLAQFKWYACGQENNNYAKREVKGKTESIHRIVMARIIGRNLLPEEKVDHADGNRFNNCRSNLRLASQRQNCQNVKKGKANTSGYKGVSWHVHAWMSQISINGKKTYLGLYDTPEQAHEAYMEAARKHFKEFARPE